jgi:uncharacterized protein (UPF0332 family)
MKQCQYTYEEKKRASTLLALCLSELEAAEVLVEKDLARESVVHLYFACFYASQALLVQHLNTNPSHKTVEAQLHRVYGKTGGFPRRYVDLHSFLHNLRNEHSYKRSYAPDPRMIKRKLAVLQYYVKFAFKAIPKIETLEIINGIYEANKSEIRDFSYDIYCPKTYAHHTRLTFWQPPYYRGTYGPEALARNSRRLLRSLKVHRPKDYVVGLNSKLDQYRPVHLLMLDIDTLDIAVESALKEIGGILLKSGRGFHFIGKNLFLSQKEWEKEMNRVRRHKVLKNHVDRDHIEISLQRGYATLRITSSPAKPRVPVFYKEI